jgi:hypothetical protein
MLFHPAETLRCVPSLLALPDNSSCKLQTAAKKDIRMDFSLGQKIKSLACSSLRTALACHITE